MLNMNQKIENLKKLIDDTGVTMEELERLTYRNNNVPCIATLKKYKLLEMVKEEVYYEETMTEEEADDLDELMDEWDWDNERQLYVWIETRRYYKIK